MSSGLSFEIPAASSFMLLFPLFFSWMLSQLMSFEEKEVQHAQGYVNSWALIVELKNIGLNWFETKVGIMAFLCVLLDYGIICSDIKHCVVWKVWSFQQFIWSGLTGINISLGCVESGKLGLRLKPTKDCCYFQGFLRSPVGLNPSKHFV